MAHPSFIHSFIHSFKRSSYIEKDCLKKSENYYSTGDRTAELNIHLEYPISTKTLRRELYKSNIHGRAAIGKPKLLKVMLRFVNDGVTTIKSGHQTVENACMIWSDESSFTLFPTSERVYIRRTPEEAYNPECRFQQ
jgi:hypothetical protein